MLIKCLFQDIPAYSQNCGARQEEGGVCQPLSWGRRLDIQEQGAGVALGLTAKLPTGEGSERLIKRVGEKLLVKRTFLEVCIHKVGSMIETIVGEK